MLSSRKLANASGDVIEDVVKKKKKKKKGFVDKNQSWDSVCVRVEGVKTAPVGRGASWTYCHCGLKIVPARLF